MLRSLVGSEMCIRDRSMGLSPRSLGSPRSLRMRSLSQSVSVDSCESPTRSSVPTLQPSDLHREASSRNLEGTPPEEGTAENNRYVNSYSEWERHRVLGVPMWLRGADKIKSVTSALSRQLVMRLKTNSLGATSLVADLTALLFCAMGTVKPLTAVYKSVLKDDKIGKFLSMDFNDEANQGKASKNAFKLSSIHRNHLAAAFFLLAKEPWHAINICVNQIKDVNLAFLIARLSNDDQLVRRCIQEKILPVARSTADNCLVSLMQSWMNEMEAIPEQHQHLMLNALLENPQANQTEHTPPSLSAFAPSAIWLHDSLSPQKPAVTYDYATPAGETALSTIYTYLTEGCPAVALLVCASGITQLGPHPVHKSVVENILVQCIANLVFASKNGSASFDASDPAKLAQDVCACHPAGLQSDHTPNILAMFADGSRCRRQLKPRCIAAAAAQGPEMVIKILWNEFRQPLVALYRYGRSAVEGDKDTLAQWLPCAFAWVSRMKEVIDTTIELHQAKLSELERLPHWEAASPKNQSESGWFSGAEPECPSDWQEVLCHANAHVICVAMASAMVLKDYGLMLRILEIEKETQSLETMTELLTAVLENVDQDPGYASPSVTPTCRSCSQSPMNQSDSPRSPRNRLKESVYPLADQISSQMLLYVCAALRNLLLRIIGEDLHAASLKTLQVLGCVDAWQHGYTKVASSGSARIGNKALPDADRVEQSYLHDYDGGLCTEEGSKLWLWLRKHKHVQDLITYSKHTGWAQIKTRWNTGARFFVLERGCLASFEVGDAEANYSDASAWSPPLKHYTAVDEGLVEDLYKITIAPLSHKKSFQTYNIYCDTEEEQLVWLRKLERHCCDAEKAAKLERVRSDMEAITGKR
eukprot:TRINITY_DN55138_c0_g2_i5.p1 TRINITY_DN55138_c0_g2~~TRINITY_DN55138_c0_g2_i5.p1  ORF type:complete len:893 (+),score=227.20 TRINITY_DN55138_c0_g2_i5:62-2680(+)